MEKFKIYIHHHYTYELFWYFCHGVEIEPNDIFLYNQENRFNKNIISFVINSLIILLSFFIIVEHYTFLYKYH